MTAIDRWRPAARRRPVEVDRLEELRARRVELAERVAELTWDLGGLTYEMAIRDHFRLNVLVRHAAVLQEADAELGELERMLAANDEGIAGQCRSCGADHSRGAVYCWKCGQPLLPEAFSSVVPAPAPRGGAPTQIMRPLDEHEPLSGGG